MMACTPWNAHAGCKAKLLLPRRRLRGKPRAEPALFVAEERTKQREPCVSRSRSWPSPGRAGTKMEWPRLPRSSCKSPVQLLLCPPSHSQLCELPLHLSPRPQPQRHARANEPESSSPSSSSREAAAKSHLPSILSPTQKRAQSTTFQSNILLVSTLLFLRILSTFHTHQSNPSPHPPSNPSSPPPPPSTPLISSTFLTSFLPTSLQPLPRLPELVHVPSTRTCNGFEYYACGDQDQGYSMHPLRGRARGALDLTNGQWWRRVPSETGKGDVPSTDPSNWFAAQNATTPAETTHRPLCSRHAYCAAEPR